MTKLPLFLILLLAVAITTLPVFADEDDDDDERIGLGEREDDEREDDDDDERIGLGTGVSDMVLYVTIAAIVGTIGYTGFRIISAKRPKMIKK